MSLNFFGTDGIRGLYGSETLNDEIAFRAGKAAVRAARDSLRNLSPQIVVGRDTRASGLPLLAAFAKGVHSEGGMVVDLGIVPTPCVAFATRTSDATLGCSITASHNPACDNGLKFFDGKGVKLSETLERYLDTAVGQTSVDCIGDVDTNERIDGRIYAERYVKAILAHFPEGMLVGKRVALDCANGAMFEIAPAVFRRLGAKLSVVGDAPNGNNINEGVGSECPESLGALYRKSDYDLGFAFDGDGDRLVMVDHGGSRLAGESLLTVLAIDAQERGRLVGDTLVTTVQSNLGLDKALMEQGIKVVRTDVGDKHIVRLMQHSGFSVGGEESGHIVIGSFAVTGDGLVAAVALSDVIVRKASRIEVLASVYQAFPQSSKAIRIVSKPDLENCPAISASLAKLEKELGSNGRLLVRYSGTEPKIRLLVEARTQELVTSVMNELLASVEADLDLV